MEINESEIEGEITAETAMSYEKDNEDEKAPDTQKLNRQTSTVSSSSTSSLKSISSRLNLFARFHPRNTPGSEEVGEEAVGKRWRNIRNAVKATNAVSARKKSPVTREDSFLKRFSTRQPYRVESDTSIGQDTSENVQKRSVNKHRLVFRLDGSFMLYWLGVVTVSVLYNLWTCIAREAFREIQKDYQVLWIVCDAACDLVYILDMVCQFRTGYLDQGIMVFDSLKLATKYVKSKNFCLDLMCLLPLDFLQFVIGIHPMLRFPRFIKVYRAFKFMHMMESRTAYPNFFRVANLTHILFLGSHWFAAFYYLISEAEDFAGDWSYPKPDGEFASVTRKYLASLFWSTLTLTTIGDLPPPESNWEYVFVIVSYLIGVFIFATIVGQVGNVITNRNAGRQEFERLLDGAKLYMRMHSVPPELQKRVQRWYDYVWKRGRMKGADINSLGMLPDKFKTELAIHVNLETLKKVTIFQECQPEFLHDLVLKMRAYIFTPGDLICRRGEVAREMFIVADGLVEIISETGTVLTQMGAGDFFGEIGILNLDGGINRRTADVKSVGYSELFGLSREDVLEALKDHPDAERIIRDYGQRRLNEIEKHRKKKIQPVPQKISSHWSPSAPVKGLRNLISPIARRKNMKHVDIPGISITDFDEDSNVTRQPQRNSGGFVSQVKNFVIKTRNSQHRKRQSKNQRHNQTSLVHPSDSDSSLMYSSCGNSAFRVKKGDGRLQQLCDSDTNKIEGASSDNCLNVHMGRHDTGTNDTEQNDLNSADFCTPTNTNCDFKSNDDEAVQSESRQNLIDTNAQDMYHNRNAERSTNEICLLCGHDNGEVSSADLCTNTNIQHSSIGYSGRSRTKERHKDLSRVLHGVTNKPFVLPVHFPDIQEERTPPETPESSRRSSIASDDRVTCCCNQLQRHLQLMDQRLSTMETAYKESLQKLSEIAAQQRDLFCILKPTSKIHKTRSLESPTDTEVTKL